jgi:hypothetical protein
MTLDTTVAFVIPLVALLTSLPGIWHKEQLWNFSVHHSNLVLLYSDDLLPNMNAVSKLVLFADNTSIKIYERAKRSLENIK